MDMRQPRILEMENRRWTKKEEEVAVKNDTELYEPEEAECGGGGVNLEQDDQVADENEDAGHGTLEGEEYDTGRNEGRWLILHDEVTLDEPLVISELAKVL